MDVKLKLSLHPDWVIKKSEIEVKMLEGELAAFPSLQEGQVEINGAYLVKWEDKLEVGFYLRNATKETLYFGSTPLKIIDKSGKVLASQTHNLSEMGDIEPLSSRPWEIFFDNSNAIDEIEINDWQIEFDLQQDQPPYAIVIEDKSPEPLSEEKLAKLFQYLKGLPPVKEGEINISHYEAELDKEKNLKVSIIARNGLPYPIKLARFQIAVADAKGRTAAKAVFNIEDAVIEQNMFLFRTFTYPTKTMLTKDIDLSHWQISFI